MKGASKDAISSSISYIESKLLENLDIDELAGQIFFSRTHYQRLFHAIVGEPVIEYIKKRRLQQACQTLCQTNASVLEIALEYGYASHEGFTRAFKSLYGMPPTQFRKKHAPGLNQNIICREVWDMLSNEVTKGIARHTQTIAESLAQFKVDLEKLRASAEKTAKEVGPNGKGVMVVLHEVGNLSAKTGELIKEVKGFTCEDKSVFEISDGIYLMLKCIDDLAFQTHLLRFLSGIEVARTGSDAFSAYQSEFTGLSSGLQNHHGMATGMLKELMSLLLADIRSESARSMRSAVDLVNKATFTGKTLTEETKTTALTMGSNGAGFMQISTEVEKCAAKVMEVAAVLERYADDLEKGEASPDSAKADRAINSLWDIAFTMNLTGFNTTVEAARAGGREELVKYSDKIKAYAMQLHQTYTSCAELFKECVKLSGLLVREEHPDSIPNKFQKVLDDVILQGGMLTMQLAMESARSGKDVFKRHAKNAEAAVVLLSSARQGDFKLDWEALLGYYNTISGLVKSCHADAEANMPQGITFAYIAREFDVFIGKISAVLEKMK